MKSETHAGLVPGLELHREQGFVHAYAVFLRYFAQVREDKKCVIAIDERRLEDHFVDLHGLAEPQSGLVLDAELFTGSAAQCFEFRLVHGLPPELVACSSSSAKSSAIAASTLSSSC